MTLSDIPLQRPSVEGLGTLLDAAYEGDDREALADVQAVLARIHARSFELPGSPAPRLTAVLDDCRTALLIEQRMIEFEDRFIDPAECPEGDGAAFVRGIKAIVREHPANRHPFYIDFLPERALVPHLAYYLTQESALDPRFDDYIALMQVGMGVEQKLELAGNYWDEMGNGEQSRVHSVMFQTALDELGATAQYVEENRIVEAVVCGNLAAMLALRRPLIYRAVGSFAVTEFLFPRRCSQLASAWARNGLSAEGIAYHREHIGVDARHASGFFRNVVAPLVDENPAVAQEIHWGVMSRLNSSQRYLDALLDRVTAKEAA